MNGRERFRMAEKGGLSEWGSGGRWFESSRPDHNLSAKWPVASKVTGHFRVWVAHRGIGTVVAAGKFGESGSRTNPLR